MGLRRLDQNVWAVGDRRRWWLADPDPAVAAVAGVDLLLLQRQAVVFCIKCEHRFCILPGSQLQCEHFAFKGGRVRVVRYGATKHDVLP